MKEIAYEEKTLNKTLSMLTVLDRNLRHLFKEGLKYFISHVPQ